MLRLVSYGLACLNATTIAVEHDGDSWRPQSIPWQGCFPPTTSPSLRASFSSLQTDRKKIIFRSFAALKPLLLVDRRPRFWAFRAFVASRRLPILLAALFEFAHQPRLRNRQGRHRRLPRNPD
jgi:hypothetical protein